MRTASICEFRHMPALHLSVHLLIFCTKRTSKSQRFKRGGRSFVLKVKLFYTSAAFECRFLTSCIACIIDEFCSLQNTLIPTLGIRPRREIHILDLHQGEKGRFFPPQHVFANIFMNTYQAQTFTELLKVPFLSQ